jgi:hypothetical protein
MMDPSAALPCDESFPLLQEYSYERQTRSDAAAPAGVEL